jgi:hypothetical protein
LLNEAILTYPVCDGKPVARLTDSKYSIAAHRKGELGSSDFPFRGFVRASGFSLKIAKVTLAARPAPAEASHHEG